MRNIITQIRQDRKRYLAWWQFKESLFEVTQWNVHNRNCTAVTTSGCFLRVAGVVVAQQSPVLRLIPHVEQQSTTVATAVVVVAADGVVVLRVVPPFFPGAKEQSIATPICFSCWRLYHLSNVPVS